ncbi:MAG TPA: DNA mismatch repair endonuclease MutL [Candidatus Marinimicrobia bacterium]|jgi:DNA mismatch repair protein MutL|nr:DNA mismatch repair endonuclease MutL [Candidatus Neomarinimicrobiota bacterium]
MKPILSLPEDLRNKISAGEVIERPASVVKELLENSIDAGATEITVVVEKGGHQLIQVRDNGHGITADGLAQAFLRYTTSKISKVDDLFKIRTLGFRGEALASIASVSEINVSSSVDESAGYQMDLVNGVTDAIKAAPPIGGTEITVRNLFYNTPARKKFLKSATTEFRQIVKMLRRFGLEFPEVSFQLMHNDKTILNLTPENIEERIIALTDPSYRDQLLPVNMIKGDYNISGFVGTLNLVRGRPGEQYLFVNRRFIQNRLLNSAVYAAYESLVKRGEYPFSLLNLVLPPDQLDVNVHPRKIEVRFTDEWRIYHVVKSAVREALASILATIPSFEQHVGQMVTFGKEIDPNQRQEPLWFTPAKQSESGADLQRAKEYVSNLADQKEEATAIEGSNMWQVHDKYIISQIISGLVIIDQHVAHERVLFEDALLAFDSTPLSAQTLLFPEILEFSADEYSVLLDIQQYLEKLGFRMKENGQNKILLEAIPSDMGWGNENSVIRDIIDHYMANREKSSSYMENLAASFACHAAVKAGDSLTMEEMQVLVNRLFATKHPYYCPHGRPIIVQLSLEELDQRFERS